MANPSKARDCPCGQDARAPGKGTTCLVGPRQSLARAPRLFPESGGPPRRHAEEGRAAASPLPSEPRLRFPVREEMSIHARAAFASRRHRCRTHSVYPFG